MKILDACCGSRMFWFDKHNPLVAFMDNRNFEDILCDGRSLQVKPDVIGDFRNIPFSDESFNLVVFDPPHLLKVGEKSWLAKKYGKLNAESWKEDIKKGFSECFRVLKKRWNIGVQVERDGYCRIRYFKTLRTKAVNWPQKR